MAVVVCPSCFKRLEVQAETKDYCFNCKSVFFVNDDLSLRTIKIRNAPRKSKSRFTGKSKTSQSEYAGWTSAVFGILILLIALFGFLGFDNLSITLFMITWVGGLLTSIFVGLNNAVGDAKIAHEVTEHDFKIEIPDIPPPEMTEIDYGKRLRELETLKKEQLITPEEYQTKRQDILDEDWGK